MIECDPQPSYHFEALVGMCAPIWCQGTTAETAPVELKRLIELVDLGTGVAECKHPSTVAAVTVGLDVPGRRDPRCHASLLVCEVLPDVH
jgi:hypothetical protein